MDIADADPDLGSAAPEHAPPSLVFLSTFTTPFSRRLSSCFTEPRRPVPSARKNLAYISLQGRLINAEEATSAREIGGGLSKEEIVAWELFSPIQRVTTVAVIGAAVAESRKNRTISQLKKSVEVRDQLLSSMQQKLDSLFEQVNNVSNQNTIEEASPEKNAIFPFNSNSESDGIKFIDCGCWSCDQHYKQFSMFVGDSETRMSTGSDMFPCQKASMEEPSQAEQEERRMSDLSDWASSVTSSSEIRQMNGLCIEEEHHISNLKKECEEKDATIRELTEFLHSSDAAGSKRISELEDIIRRKNMIITKLKKDMLVLEQKVMQLTRLRRPSSAHKEEETIQIPFMAENILYDIDSTTSPSSSDSDGSPIVRTQTPVLLHQIQRKYDSSVNNNPSTTGGYPLRDISLNHEPNKISSGKQKQLSSSGGGDSRRRRLGLAHPARPTKDAASKRRWS